MGWDHPFGMMRQTQQFPNSRSSKETQTFPAFLMNAERLRNFLPPEKNNGIIFPSRLNGNDPSAPAVKPSRKLGSSGKRLFQLFGRSFLGMLLLVFRDGNSACKSWIFQKKPQKSGIWDGLSQIIQLIPRKLAHPVRGRYS